MGYRRKQQNLKFRTKTLCAIRKNRRLSVLRSLKSKRNENKENIHPLLELNDQPCSSISFPQKQQSFWPSKRKQNTNITLNLNSDLNDQPCCSKTLVQQEQTIREQPILEVDLRRDENRSANQSMGEDGIQLIHHDHDYPVGTFTENEKIRDVMSTTTLSDHDYCLKNNESNELASVTGCDTDISGRRIFDINHLFRQILNGKKHEPFNCDITDMNVVCERRIGLLSKFYLKCKMCGVEDTLTTEEKTSELNMDINTAMTLASVSSGIGFAQLDEVAASINMPMMTNKTYSKYHDKVSDVILQTAWQTMEEAGREEARLAQLFGEVDRDNVPCITVIADGAWGKRSYKVNYDSASGVACIIGFRTGKLLHLGVRNKYCSTCARAEAKKLEVPSHKCFKNWEGTSTSMETDIIAEGFRLSIPIHGIKYTKLVGDGDSSVYKKLIQTRPYGTVLVEKVECRNHLMRNFSTNLREISNRKRSNSKNVPVPPFLRKEIANKSLRLRTAITKATQYRINEENNYEQKFQLLTEDILNAPSHVFGEHKKCKDIQYFKCEENINEVNLVPSMSECGVYQDIEACLQRLISNVNSLILNMDTNVAEHYNSIVCKFVGGKRINYSLRGSYNTRCEAAAISFNCEGDYHRTVYKAFVHRSPTTYTKRYITRMKKRKLYKIVSKRRNNKSKIRKKKIALPDKDYGPEANEPLMTDVAYNIKKEEFLKQLKITQKEIMEIENSTRGQSGNPKWIQERSIRLTASNFGQVSKMRPTTSCVSLVKNLLYGNFLGNKSTKYGIESETYAIQDFESIYNVKVNRCGLFIDETEYYLAASPDGLVGDDCIVEIKCPAVIRNITPQLGITEKKIKFASLENNKLHLKRNHNYYYQVQGQLAITKKSKCYFCVWSRNGLLVEEIERDEVFWEEKMLPLLKTFYFTCLLPEIIDPQHPKGYPIRNPDRT